MKLTTKILENAKPKSKTYRLWDAGSGGLHYEITPQGGKWARYKYRLNERQIVSVWAFFQRLVLKMQE